MLVQVGASSADARSALSQPGSASGGGASSSAAENTKIIPKAAGALSTGAPRKATHAEEIGFEPGQPHRQAAGVPTPRGEMRGGPAAFDRLRAAKRSQLR